MITDSFIAILFVRFFILFLLYLILFPVDGESHLILHARSGGTNEYRGDDKDDPQIEIGGVAEDIIAYDAGCLEKKQDGYSLRGELIVSCLLLFVNHASDAFHSHHPQGEGDDSKRDEDETGGEQEIGGIEHPCLREILGVF